MGREVGRKGRGVEWGNRRGGEGKEGGKGGREREEVWDRGGCYHLFASHQMTVIVCHGKVFRPAMLYDILFTLCVK